MAQRVLGRRVFLVSSIDLPIEADSLPLHVVGHEPFATEQAVAQLVAERRDLQPLYGGWLASLHPEAWKEIEAMVRRTGKGLDFNLEAAIDAMGVDRIIKTVGLKRVIELLGPERVVDEIGLDQFLARLSPAKRRELKRRLQ